MATDRQFISYAQNAEDVVLWRALRHIPQGRYVEVGANDPLEASITRAFYERGWAGVEVEPVKEFADAFRAARPRDIVVEAAIADTDDESVTMFVVDGTGLSTLDAAIAERHAKNGWDVREQAVPVRRLDDVLDEHLSGDDEVHFMVVDAEGSEATVLASIDLRRRRPWVLVIEATAPATTEPTHDQWEGKVVAAGYTLCLFDGLSRFYVADEHAADLRDALSTPTNPLDDFLPHRVQQLQSEVSAAQAELQRVLVERDEAVAEQAQLRHLRDELIAELVRWRGAVLARWAEAAAGGGGGVNGKQGHEVVRLREELIATHNTLSWRITAPLRAVQSRRLRGWQ